MAKTARGFTFLNLALAALLLAGPAVASECDAPAEAAERAFDLPAHLLAAIGRVETGRRAPSGAIVAWPWSVNASGQGYSLQTRAEAAALVAALQAQGVQSIDVGCFQVNLLYHPDAFASVGAAFDPATNAMAAGRFLRALRDAAPGWDEAVARYHSANPTLGLPYMRQVMAQWLGGPATGGSISRVAAVVRVIVPGVWATARPLAALHLPVVITPSRSSL